MLSLSIPAPVADRKSDRVTDVDWSRALDTITQRVKAGVVWLDAFRPGRLDSLDPDEVDLAFVASHVLTEAEQDTLSADLQHTCGWLATGLFGREIYAEYVELTSAWQRAIRERRARR